MKATMILPLLGLVSVMGSSACATFVRTQPVYEPVYTPVYAPARTVVVERDAPYYSPTVYHTTYVTRSAPSTVYVHSRERPDYDDGGGYVAHNGNGYGHSRGGNTVVVVNNGGRDNGRGNDGHNNGHGNGDNRGRGNGNGNGHSRGR